MYDLETIKRLNAEIMEQAKQDAAEKELADKIGPLNGQPGNGSAMDELRKEIRFGIMYGSPTFDRDAFNAASELAVDVRRDFDEAE